MLGEILIFSVFSVDPINKKFVATNAGQNYIIYVDDRTQYEKDLFKRSFDKVLNGNYIRISAAGTIDEGGNLRASLIKPAD